MNRKRLTLRTTVGLVVFLAIAGTALLLYIPWFVFGQRDIRRLTQVANNTVMHDLTLRLRYLLEDTDGVFDILRYDVDHPEIDLSEHHELFLFALLSNRSFQEIGYIDGEEDYRLLKRLSTPNQFAFVRFRPDNQTPVFNLPADVLTINPETARVAPEAVRKISVPNPLRADWYLDPRHETGEPVWTGFQAESDTNILKTTYARSFVNPEGQRMTAYIRIHLDPPEESIVSLRKGVDLNLFLLNREGRILAQAARQVPEDTPGDPDARGQIPSIRLALIETWMEANRTRIATLQEPLHMQFQAPESNRSYGISLQPIPDSDWIIGTILPTDMLALHAIRHFYLQAWFLPILALMALLLTLHHVRRFLERPLQALRARIDRLQDLDFSAPATKDTDFAIEELHEMNEAVNRMDTALRSFRTYIPADLIRQQMHAGQAARLGCTTRTLTILRTRIADWDTLLAMDDSDPLLRRYPEYLEAITTAILTHGGTIDTFVDGTLHAFFGAPLTLPHQERQACHAVLRAREHLRALQDAWIAEGLPPLHTHFALHTGEALVGNIGTPARMSYSAIGSAVRMAGTLSRYHDLYGADVILSESTFRAAGTGLRIRPLDRLPSATNGGTFELFELLGESGEEDALSGQEERIRPYRMGYRAFWDGDYAQAMVFMREFLHGCPGDTAARLYLDRCEEKRKQATGPNWTALTDPHGGRASPPPHGTEPASDSG